MIENKYFLPPITITFPIYNSIGLVSALNSGRYRMDNAILQNVHFALPENRDTTFGHFDSVSHPTVIELCYSATNNDSTEKEIVQIRSSIFVSLPIHSFEILDELVHRAYIDVILHEANEQFCVDGHYPHHPHEHRKSKPNY